MKENLKEKMKKVGAVLLASTMLVGMIPVGAVQTSAATAKKAYKENISLKEACVALGFLTAERFDEVFHPEEMAYPYKK